jgi:ParB-like chromosome segregation protein Spo0J
MVLNNGRTADDSEPGGENARSAPALSEVHRVPVAELLPSDSPRHAVESTEHAMLLAESDARMPPIIVHRPTMRVIDGTHRVRAAALRGQAEIEVRFFDGSPEDAFVLAVEVNTQHGLPLSLSERTAAVHRILRTHPQWSDRVVASVVGLSSKTVGARRRELGGAPTEAVARIGKDGRARPVSSAEGRRLAARLIQESPDASLREIARRAGISTGTVGDVRARLARGEDVVPLRQRGGSAPQEAPDSSDSANSAAVAAGYRKVRLVHDRDSALVEELVEVDLADVFRSLCRDPSLRMSESGRQLLRMVELHMMDRQHWDTVAHSIPAHRAQLVSALAMECAQRWQRLASQVQNGSMAPVA